MSQTLEHRGADDDGMYANGEVALGCRRLAIIDVAEGRQPVCNPDHTIHVVHDGAIINYRQLRRDLEATGHTFRTTSDAEVVVHLYEEHGADCVQRLRGIFALALWDANQHRLLLARDQLGHKPLFYLIDREALFFASEPKALLAIRPNARQMDYDALYDYLSLRFLPAPLTMLRGIRKLPPAHVLLFDSGAIRVSRYWDLSFRNKSATGDAVQVEGLRETLREAVARNMVGDVPVGAFLSGGLDSSLIVAMMAKCGRSDFATFLLRSEHPEFDELLYAKAVSRRFHTRLLETTARTDLIDLLPKIVWHLDEPSDPVAANKFLASRLASREVKVVLGGDGGDELFAGFERYYGVLYLNHLSAVAAPFARLLGPMIDRLPAGFGYRSTTERLRWVQRVARARGVAESFAEGVCFFRFDEAAKHRLLCDDVRRQIGRRDSRASLVHAFGSSDAEHPLEGMLYTDYTTRLPEHSLMLNDRLGMAHGVEIRCPLADHQLVSYVAGLPIDMKFRGRRPKYLARKLGEDELPELIVRRRKAGFRVPLAAWLASDLYALLEKALLESRCAAAGIFRADTMAQLLREHRERRTDHSVRLWMLLNVEIWYRLVIEQNSPEAVGQWIRELRCTMANSGRPH
jgi:asparagine synthase (glutamine-hydrolysing)